MNEGRKKKGNTPTFTGPDDPRRIKAGIGQREQGPFEPFKPVKKRGWSNAQWEQSQKFWEKKNQKVERRINAQNAHRLNAENKFMANLPQQRKNELSELASHKLVSGGKEGPMPNAQGVVPPNPNATRHYKEVMQDISTFLDPHAPVRSKFNEGGPQLIQPLPNQWSRRVGVDVEPSGHVQSLKPHLNLQTQHQGTIQGGDLTDPHHPIQSFDPFHTSANHPLKRGDQPTLQPGDQHPLQGKLTSDEKRAFMERYLRSNGTPIKRE